MDVQTLQKKSATTKIGEQISCGYSVSTIWAFEKMKNRHTSYRAENCMRKFCNSLRQQLQM